jgi:hypothetical protein
VVVVSCRLSATGVRFSGHPSPARELGLPHGRLTTTVTGGGPCRGFHVPHSRVTTGLGAFSTPGTAVLTLDRMPCPASACRITTACPYTPLPHPTTELLFTRHQRRFTRFTRPVCPSPVTPRVGQGSFGFPLRLRTLPLPATHAKGGARHRARAQNYAADLMSALLTASPLAKCDIVSQRQISMSADLISVRDK